MIRVTTHRRIDRATSPASRRRFPPFHHQPNSAIKKAGREAMRGTAVRGTGWQDRHLA